MNSILKNYCLLVLFMLLLFRVTFAQDNKIQLSGEWQVKLDPNNEQQMDKADEAFKSEGTIVLPGSLAENGYGIRTIGSDFGMLTPEYKYIGKARYMREIYIPPSWRNKEIEIFLERVLWESRIFIDGKELSRQDALGTPHVHRLGKLSSGTHELAVLVNNEMIHNIGD